MGEAVFTYRGLVERPTKNGFRMAEGYSETGAKGSILFPWMTKRECRAAALSSGREAKFRERLGLVRE